MSVSQEVYEALTDKIATLEQQVTELENEAAKGVHSCHADCPRPMCVLRRELEAVKAELDTDRQQLAKVAGAAKEVLESYRKNRDLFYDMETLRNALAQPTGQEPE